MEKWVGDRIRERRNALKMSQESLAEAAGVSRVTISKLENGHCEDILVGTLTAIASALESSVEIFLP